MDHQDEKLTRTSKLTFSDLAELLPYCISTAARSCCARRRLLIGSLGLSLLILRRLLCYPSLLLPLLVLEHQLSCKFLVELCLRLEIKNVMRRIIHVVASATDAGWGLFRPPLALIVRVTHSKESIYRLVLVTPYGVQNGLPVHANQKCSAVLPCNLGTHNIKSS